MALISLSVMSLVSYSQNKISLSKRSPVYMDLTRSFNAGSPKKVVVDDSQWLNFTTLVNLADPNLTITAQVVAGSIPDGVEMYVEVVPYKGMSKGNHGTSARKIRLTNMSRILIYDIGTCYTGSGRNVGYQLIYSFVVKDYSKVKSGKFALYVQYTITQ